MLLNLNKRGDFTMNENIKGYRELTPEWKKIFDKAYNEHLETIIRDKTWRVVEIRPYDENYIELEFNHGGIFYCSINGNMYPKN